MRTSQHRIETGSNDINPHKRLISFISLLRSQISKTKTVVEFSNQVIRKHKPSKIPCAKRYN